MVAIIAERTPPKTEARTPPPALASLAQGKRKTRIVFLGCDESRQARRRPSALKAWLMTLDGSSRGYALDISETGARLGGVCSKLEVGVRVLCKIELERGEVPLVLRAEVVRNDGRDCAVRFYDVNLDDWFRLARFVDRGPAK